MILEVHFTYNKMHSLHVLCNSLTFRYKEWYKDLFAAQGLLAVDNAPETQDDPEAEEDDFLDFLDMVVTTNLFQWVEDGELGW